MNKYGKSSDVSATLGVLDVFQIIFIVLRLVGVIDWSWWVVLIPLWVTIGLVGLMLLYSFTNKLWR